MWCDAPSSSLTSRDVDERIWLIIDRSSDSLIGVEVLEFQFAVARLFSVLMKVLHRVFFYLFSQYPLNSGELDTGTEADMEGSCLASWGRDDAWDVCMVRIPAIFLACSQCRHCRGDTLNSCSTCVCRVLWKKYFSSWGNCSSVADRPRSGHWQVGLRILQSRVRVIYILQWGLIIGKHSHSSVYTCPR